VVNVYYRQYDLPWTIPAEDLERFQRILRAVLGAALVLAILLPWLPVPEREETVVPDVPPRLAKLMMEQRVQPPPPPPPKPEPVEAEKPPEKKIVKPEPVPVDRRQQAREKAAVAGLLPFTDALADLRDNESLSSLDNKQTLTGAVGDGPRVERSLITSKVGRGSGGINTASMSRNTGGAGPGARGTTRVSSTVSGMAEAAGAPVGVDGKASRSREEIEMVFDQNKGAIYALYSRALRKDPTLQGKLVLQLTIEPSGAVSSCQVVSSELDDQELLAKLVQRVKMFRFLEKDVATVTTTKPIDFFPA
jgi:outer membrane biosynthesis protein TonB